MTLTLELAPELQEVLTEEARKQKTTPEALATETLQSLFVKPKSYTEARLRRSLALLIEQAEALEPQPQAYIAKYDTEFGEILRGKYRKQGFLTVERACDAED